jgi:hypothetical protein
LNSTKKYLYYIITVLKHMNETAWEMQHHAGLMQPGAIPGMGPESVSAQINHLIRCHTKTTGAHFLQIHGK